MKERSDLKRDHMTSLSSLNLQILHTGPSLSVCTVEQFESRLDFFHCCYSSRALQPLSGHGSAVWAAAEHNGRPWLNLKRGVGEGGGGGARVYLLIHLLTASVESQEAQRCG